MSDEQRELGRDASASTDRSHTDQHPVPSYAMAGPGHGEPQQDGAHQAAAQPGAYGPTQQIHAPQAPGGHPGAYPGAAFPPPPGGPHSGPPTALLPEKPRKQRTMTGIVAAALIAGLVGGGAGFGGAYALLDAGRSPTSTVLGSAPASSNAVNATPGSVGAAAQTATPSTVDIRVTMPQGIAEGSGVILTANGDILTNNHVVAGSTGQIEVTLADGSQHPATIVGTSPSYDLAVIRLQGASNLTPATLGQSSALQVGQPVVAIGSPQGLTGTVTTGIISAFNRTVMVQGEDGSAVVYNGLQTDAPINQGNSGGPLVNLDGQVIGINSAIETAGQSNGSIGLGFAIPIDQARRVAQEIMNNGTATKPLLGVQGAQSGNSDDGARIAVVQPNSPAASAGLVAGDVVTKVGDARVENFSDLIARIGSYAPGQQVTLTVTDSGGGNERTVNVTLGSQPDQGANTSSGGQSQSPNPFGRVPFGQNPFGGGN
jgi:putative serine protease PepD